MFILTNLMLFGSYLALLGLFMKLSQTMISWNLRNIPGVTIHLFTSRQQNLLIQSIFILVSLLVSALQ